MRLFATAILVFIIASYAVAGLPPTTSKGGTDAANVTTFNFQFPQFALSHTGTTASMGGLIDGTNSTPALFFANDTDSGLYYLGANNYAFGVGTYAALELKKSTGAFGNVGMGSAPSSSDSYPLLIQRSNASAGTYLQISNPATDASSKASIQLSADLGANLGEISVFSAATATDAYADAMTIRPSDGTGKLSLIGGDTAGGYVTTYTAGDYTSAGEAFRFNADKSLQFMQQIATPATSATNTLKLYSKSDDHLYKLNDGGTEQKLLAGTVALGSEVSGTLGVTNGGTGTATQFTTGSVVFAGASGVYTQDNTNLFWDDTNNELGIRGSPGYPLDIWNGGIGFVIGGDSAANTRTNSTNKFSKIAGPHYTNAQPPVAITAMTSTNSANTVYLGGGFSDQNAASQIYLYTAANTTTTTGTLRVRVQNDGYVALGPAQSYSVLHVQGSYQGQLNTLSANTTLDATHQYVTVDDSAATRTITLPAASANIIGRTYHIKKMSASNSTIIAAAGSDTIDGAATQTLTLQYQSFTIVCTSATTWGIF